MGTHWQVILKQDVDKLGNAGELVRVKPGFARNYLLPRGLAAVATGENVRQIEHERRIALAISEKQKKFAEGAAVVCVPLDGAEAHAWDARFGHRAVAARCRRSTGT